MTEEQLVACVLEGLHEILEKSPAWGEIIIQISRGEPRHVNITMEIGKENMVK